MYEVGQKVNIGYYGGFKGNEKLKRHAEIVKIDKITKLIHIRMALEPAGYKTMFGYAGELKQMEKNYLQWN